MQKMRLFRKDPGLFWTLVVIWVALGVFILYPFARLFASAFLPDGRFSFAQFKETFGNAYNLKALGNSLTLALLVATAGTLLGYAFALLVCRTNLPHFTKGLISGVVLLPLISPPFTSSISLTLALGPNGYLLRLFGVDNFQIYGLLGTWISETLTYFPVAFMVITSVLNTMSANLDDAALSLGASSSRILRTVTIPLSLPGIANSFLLLFGSSLADFATPLILGGHTFPVLPTQAYLQITGMFDLHGGATLSFMLLVPALVIFWIQHMVLGGKSYVTVTGKSGAQSHFSSLPTWLIVVMTIVCTAVVAFVLYLYGIILVGSFVKVWGVDTTPTLQNYRYAFKNGRKAVTDTLVIAFVSTVIGSILGVIVGYVTQRKKFVGKRFLEFCSLLNYALPGTVVGIAYITAFNKRPFVLTGTLTILVAAYVFRYYATGIRATMASLEQIDPSLEEASMSLGAGTVSTFTHVTVPLIIPAVLTGIRYLLIHSMTAISATIFLVSVRWTLLTTRILESMTELQFTQACAFSVILIVLVFLADGLFAFLMKLYQEKFLRNSQEGVKA